MLKYLLLICVFQFYLIKSDNIFKGDEDGNIPFEEENDTFWNDFKKWRNEFKDKSQNTFDEFIQCIVSLTKIMMKRDHHINKCKILMDLFEYVNENDLCPECILFFKNIGLNMKQIRYIIWKYIKSSYKNWNTFMNEFFNEYWNEFKSGFNMRTQKVKKKASQMFKNWF